MIKLSWICTANMLATFRHNMTMWAVFGLMAILWQQDLDPVGSFCVGTVATFFPCQNPQLWYCTMKQLLPLSLFSDILHYRGTMAEKMSQFHQPTPYPFPLP
jgi:hypothetical protein